MGRGARRDGRLRDAADQAVLDAARAGDRVLVSADTDFSQILARTRATAPSVVSVRRVVNRRAEELARLLLANLPPLSDDLALGSVVALLDDSVRVRRLPLS